MGIKRWKESNRVETMHARDDGSKTKERAEMFLQRTLSSASALCELENHDRFPSPHTLIWVWLVELCLYQNHMPHSYYLLLFFKLAIIWNFLPSLSNFDEWLVHNAIFFLELAIYLFSFCVVLLSCWFRKK